ncbi:MAG: NTP transferase domain-containing protein, partial [Pseudomonadota bacterium]|nr:NTP transferase domain-containing protein [Pseudomonadota bacterium]
TFGQGLVFDDPVGISDAASSTLAFAGPLAGMHAGLAACRTPWLAVVPCDTPLFPLDLVARLAAAIEGSAARAAMVVCVTATQRAAAQPTFCMLHRDLAPQLRAAMAGGERKLGRWLQGVGALAVEFADPRAFANANTAAELAELDHGD